MNNRAFVISRSIRGFILVLLVSTFVAGCATKSVENTNSYIDENLVAELPGGSKELASDLEWIDELGDNALSEVVQSTLTDSFVLRSALSRIAQMDASARLTGAIKYPAFSLDFAHGKQESFSSSFGVIQTDINTLSLSSQWQLDLWGRARDQHASTLALLEAVGFQYEDVRLTVASSIAKTWFSVIEAKQQLDLAIQTRDSFASQLSTLEDRYLGGLIDAFDLRLFRAQTSSNEAAVSQRRNQLDVLTRRLQVLLADYPNGEYDVVGGLDATLQRIPEILSFDVLYRRPDLRAAERNLASSLANRNAAKKNRFPTLQISGSWGTSSSDISDLIDSDYLIESLIGGITAPLFAGGRLSAERDLAEAKFDEQIQNYHAAILEAFREIETAKQSEEYIESIYTELKHMVGEIRKAEVQAWDLYYGGLRDITAVLDVQRTSANAQSQLLSIQNQRLQNRIDLHVAVGGSLQ